MKTKDLLVKILKKKDLAVARAKAEKHFLYGMTNKGYQADSAGWNDKQKCGIGVL